MHRPLALDSLPFDILLKICQHVDDSERTDDLSYSIKNTRILGRRAFDVGTLNSQGSLLAFSSVNKAIRAVAEPLIFNCIVFGPKWESWGEQRWTVAKSRMNRMTKKATLKKLVKVVRFERTKAPWDELSQARPKFWGAFARFILHLESLHTVTLGFWTKNIDPYPRVFRESLHNETPESFHHELSQDLTVVGSSRHDSTLPARLLSGYLPCIGSVSMEVYEDQHQEVRMTNLRRCRPILFPNIKTAHLGRDCRWFALHCPSLDLLVDDSRFPSPSPAHINTYGQCSSSLRRLESRITATPQSITELLQDVPNIEELVLFAPFSPSGSDGLHIMRLAPLIGRFNRLRVFELKREGAKPLFPQRDRAFRETLKATIEAYEQNSETLLHLRLADFIYVRHSSSDQFITAKEKDVPTIVV
ncbi:hypothetical protein CPB86DRAFT_811545 [Serendipita vermifera]|nr:hypothetical protein CPB86DRAFT_811545 [Serendipita vermifera]